MVCIQCISFPRSHIFLLPFDLLFAYMFLVLSLPPSYLTFFLPHLSYSSSFPPLSHSLHSSLPPYLSLPPPTSPLLSLSPTSLTPFLPPYLSHCSPSLTLFSPYFSHSSSSPILPYSLPSLPLSLPSSLLSLLTISHPTLLSSFPTYLTLQSLCLSSRSDNCIRFTAFMARLIENWNVVYKYAADNIAGPVNSVIYR